jgi:Na+-translocating ferredoxin:NAD+ oxidoreductase subunit D
MTNDHQPVLISSSPHAHSGDSVQKIMVAVILALAPAFVASVIFFGWNAIRLTAVCVAVCVLSEFISRRMMRRDDGIGDFSAVVTGVLLAFNLPPTLPSWMAVLGSVVAIVVGKQLYGGIGYNLFNPALVGRTVLLISFPVAMTAWIAPGTGFAGVDGVTTATPLGAWKTGWSVGPAPAGFFEPVSLRDLPMGNRPGGVGETSALALLAGGVYLVWRRCVYWQTPVAFMGTVALFAGILHWHDPIRNLSPVYHVLTGGLVIGAFFMATDMVTTPVTKSGMLVFGVGCGVLTMVIRKWGGYPEGVSFSILIMNALTPLINKATQPRVFGHASRSG